MAATAALAVVLAGAHSAGAAAPSRQRAQLRAGEVVLQARPGRLASLRRQVEGLGLSGIAFDRLGMLAVNAPARLAGPLAALPAVRYAHNSYRLHLLDHDSTPLVYDGRQQGLWSGGFDGRGVGVAVIDSGVDATHPDLAKRTVRNEKVLPTGDALTCDACTTDTSNGHGTHVAGIAVGDGSASGGYHTGVAPGASLYAFSIGEAEELLWTLSAVDHILQLKAGGDNILVANLSLGEAQNGSARLDTTDALVQATKKLHDAGITVVVGAGNDGYGQNDDRPVSASKCDREGTGDCRMNTLSVAPWTISVANSTKDMEGGRPARQGLDLASSRGDTVPETSLDGVPNILYRPTLTAPGLDILSARATGSPSVVNCASSTTANPDCLPDPARPQDYAYYTAMSGTSMSTPQVSGAVAVIQSAAKAKLGHYLTPDEVKQLLIDSATPITQIDGIWGWPCGEPGVQPCGSAGQNLLTGRPYEEWQVGAGMLDVDRAVALLGA